MKKIIVSLILLAIHVSSFADQKASAAGDIAKKILEDFHQAIYEYNLDVKNPDEKIIKLETDPYYVLSLNKNKLKFNATDYLSNQITVNDKRVRWSDLMDLQIQSQKKTGWLFNKLSINVYASGDEFLDASSLNLSASDTKILVASIGKLTKNLEEIGLTCVLSCKNKTRKANLQKMLGTINSQLADCENQKEAQEKSLKRAKYFRMSDSLYSIYSTEFKSMKKFIEEVYIMNTKKAGAFFEDFLAYENKNYSNCPSTIASMTIADNVTRGIGDDIARGAGVGITMTSVDIQKLRDESIRFCTKLQELKECANGLSENVGQMNSLRREIKRTTGYSSKEEILPISNVLSK